jgi:hypothetical protein
MSEPSDDDVALDDLELTLGESLFHLAKFYPTVMLMVAEMVQNAVDAAAKTVFVGIDVDKHEIIVLDNGSGVTVARFQQALRSVGKGIKEPGSIGRFGLGLISPLNKCKQYKFASQMDTSPGKRGMANIWTFDCLKIKATEKGLRIPRVQRPLLPPVPKQFVRLAGQYSVAWRTMVLLEGVTDEQTVGTIDLDDLERQIRKF